VSQVAEQNEQDEQDEQPEQSPADDAASAFAPSGADEQTLAMASPMGTLAAPAEPFAVTTPPTRPMRRGRWMLLAVSVVLLVTSLAATLYIGNGGAQGLFFAFTASASPTARATTPSAPATATTALTPTMARPTSTATPRATPPIVGDGVATPVGTYPPYTGPVSGGQGCPSGQAPKPAGGAIHRASDYGAPRANAVALTFDDGPTPAYTPAILSYLEKTHTPATFFVLGQYAQAYPWLIQREAADGFTIGVHTWNHPDMQTLSNSQRAWQFSATVQQLHSDLGANTCIWLWRPPYGSYNGSIIAQAGSFGLTTIVWDDDPADWSQPGTMTIANRVLANVRPGSIILMHDGPAGRAQTLAALPYILDGLRKRGLTPVSLPQLLFGYQPPTPTPTPTHPPTPTPTPQPTPTNTPAPTPTSTPVPTATDTPPAMP
jgi:peptidoglycan/xylan/chitin deacetylase (PgdA/CDA1 family)